MLVQAVRQSEDIEEVFAFEDAEKALKWAKAYRADVAFLDIEMPALNGVELAKALRRLDPEISIVFCTGHRSYALEAFEIHADGYLVKPVSPEMIQKELDYIKERTGGHSRPLLTARLYGNFCVFDRKGEIVSFKRKKTEELLAILIHMQGQVMRVVDLCNILWNDNDIMFENNKKYLWNLLSDLRGSLDRAGAAIVLGRGLNGHFVKMDYIRLDDSGRGSLPYLSGYEWAAGGPLGETGESM